MTQQQYLEARQQALAYFEKAGIVLTEEEVEHFEVADFGLGDWRNVGLNLVTYVNTQRCCAKEMVLLPGQTCPQHTHVPFGDYPGKEETFRCRWGQVYLYVEESLLPPSVPRCRRPGRTATPCSTRLC